MSKAIFISGLLLATSVVSYGAGLRPSPAPSLGDLDLSSGDQPTETSADPIIEVDEASTEQKPSLKWHDNLESALVAATLDYAPILIYFGSPDCPWCRKMWGETLTSEEVKAALGGFVLAKIDVTLDPDAGTRHGVRGVPTTLILSANGDLRVRLRGYAGPVDFLRFVRENSSPIPTVKTIDENLEAILQTLVKKQVPDEMWPDILLAFGEDLETRKKLTELIFRFKPVPRRQLVEMLSHERLAVRLGAIEILEELSGRDHGFNPWEDAAISAGNREALKKWREWAEMTDEEVESVYAALDEERCRQLLWDVLSENRGKAARARRMIKLSGPRSVVAIRSFLSKNPELSAEMRRKIKEVEYAVVLPDRSDFNSAKIAKQLVFANLDVRLKAIAALKRVIEDATPVLADLIEDPDPLAREAVIDALSESTDKRAALKLLETRAKVEEDEDVLFCVVRALGEFRVKKSILILNEFLDHGNEDLVVAALNSLSKLRAKLSAEYVAKCLKSPHWRVRVAALKVIADLEARALLADVERLLEDPDQYVRHNAVLCLARIADKQCAGKLKDLFLKDDALKGACLIALCQLDVETPKELTNHLRHADDNALNAVTQALGSCDEKALPVAKILIEKDNPDVAIPALAFVARTAFRSDSSFSETVPILSERLQNEDDPRAILAILNNLDLSDDERVSVIDTSNAISSDDDGAAPTLEIDDETRRRNKERLDAVFAAFAGKPKTAGGSAPTLTTKAIAKDHLKTVVRGLHDRTKNAEVAFHSALILAKGGDRDAAARLIKQYEDLDGSDHLKVAEALLSERQKPPSSFLLKLLVEKNQRIHFAVFLRVLKGGYPDLVPKIFAMLRSEDSPVKLTDMVNYHFGEMLKKLPRHSSVRNVVRGEIASILRSKDTGVALKNFAMYLLERLWEPGDEALLEPFFSSPNLWLRRAALFCAAAKDVERCEERFEAIVNDSSDKVRIIIPALSTRLGRHNASKWTYVFDDDLASPSRSYWGSQRSPALLAKRDVVLKYLKTLSSDPTPQVRFEALMGRLRLFQPLDIHALVEALKAVPDRKKATEELSEFFMSNHQYLGPSFAVLVPMLSEDDIYPEAMKRIRQQFKLDSGAETHSAATEPTTKLKPEVAKPALASFVNPPTIDDEGLAVEPPRDRPVRIVFFTNMGCDDCAAAKSVIEELRGEFPKLEVEERDIGKVSAMRLNETLSERFRVPAENRLVAPAVFASSGCLIKDEIALGPLFELVRAAAINPDDDWRVVEEPDLARSEEVIGERYHAFSLGVVALAGFLDGINPCAFATVIFFLSYLQLARRSPRELLGVGGAFILGVFLAYYVLGLGLVEVIIRLSVIKTMGLWLNRIMAALAFVIMVLCVYDGVLCARGKLAEIKLQLPDFLKERIRRTIRVGGRHRRFIAAAFVVGVIISLLELACTGQVYAPTILFMLKTGADRGGALAYLAFYNFFFIAPLLIIFTLAYFGMRSETLTAFLHRHAAAVKFATALIFLIIFLFLIHGDADWGLSLTGSIPSHEKPSQPCRELARAGFRPGSAGFRSSGRAIRGKLNFN